MPAHAANGDFTPTPESLQREADAVALRAKSMPYREIAERLGFADESGARHAVQRGLIRIGRETIVESRQLMLDRIEIRERILWDIIAAQHPLVQQGKIIRENTPDGPITIQDSAPVLAALAELRKLDDQRAGILGIKAARRVEVITRDAVDQAIIELAAEHAGRGLALPAGIAEAVARVKGAG